MQGENDNIGEKNECERGLAARGVPGQSGTLSRRVDERICIQLPDKRLIWVQVVRIEGDRVRLGVTAPREITVDRAEVSATRKKSERNRESGDAAREGPV